MVKVLGSLLSSGALSKGSNGGVLGNILGSVIGGAQNQKTSGGGSLGDIIGSLVGGSSSTGSSTSGGGVFGNLIGSVLGGNSSGGNTSGGGLGDILGSVLGGGSQSNGNVASGNVQADSKKLEDMLGVGNGGLGSLIGGALAKFGQTSSSSYPTPAADDNSMLPSDVDPQKANDQANLIITAMINAAKADGKFDRQEQEKLLSKLGNITNEEKTYIQSEFNAPLNMEAFANSVPRGMEHQIYAVSLSAIDLDQNSEAQYLSKLADLLRISHEEVNQIHAQLGAPKIFA